MTAVRKEGSSDEPGADVSFLATLRSSHRPLIGPLALRCLVGEQRQRHAYYLLRSPDVCWV